MDAGDFMMNFRAVLLPALIIGAALTLGAPIATAAGRTTCALNAKDGLFGGGYGVLVNGECVELGADGDSGAAAVHYRTIGCTRTGHQVVNGVTLAALCPTPVPRCTLLAEGGMSGTPFWAYLVQYRTGNGPWTSGNYWCPQTQGQSPAPDAAAIREQAIRLLPTVGIGTTDNHVSLVNIQTVFWAETGSRRSLGTVVITGHRVWLRVAFGSAHWTFGDGTADVADTPGSAYDKAGDPCSTPACPDYYGHWYRAPGRFTVRLQVSWQASWSLDGTHFSPVADGPISGPTATYPLTVKQAKGVLVANSP